MSAVVVRCVCVCAHDYSDEQDNPPTGMEKGLRFVGLSGVNFASCPR